MSKKLELVITLDKLMARDNLTAHQLATAIGLHESNLGHIKNATGKAIKLSVLLRLCEVLDCTPNDLFEVRPFDPNDRRGKTVEEFKKERAQKIAS